MRELQKLVFSNYSIFGQSNVMALLQKTVTFRLIFCDLLVCCYLHSQVSLLGMTCVNWKRKRVKNGLS